MLRKNRWRIVYGSVLIYASYRFPISSTFVPCYIHPPYSGSTLHHENYCITFQKDATVPDSFFVRILGASAFRVLNRLCGTFRPFLSPLLVASFLLPFILLYHRNSARNSCCAPIESVCKFASSSFFSQPVLTI